MRAVLVRNNQRAELGYQDGKLTLNGLPVDRSILDGGTIISDDPGKVHQALGLSAVHPAILTPEQAQNRVYIGAEILS